MVLSACAKPGAEAAPADTDIVITTEPPAEAAEAKPGPEDAGKSGSGDETKTTDAEEPVNSYNVSLVVNPRNREVSGLEKVKYYNRTGAGLSSVYFKLNLNAFGKDAPRKPYFDSMEAKVFQYGRDYGEIKVISASVNKEPASFLVSGSCLRLDLPEELPAGADTDMTLQFSAKIPKISHRTGANENALWCGNFLPTLSVYDDKGWHTEDYTRAGDPFYTETANFTVTLAAPPGYAAAATGSAGKEENVLGPDGQALKSVTYTANLSRDFAFALSDKYQKKSAATPQGVTINIYTYSDADAEKYLDTAQKALDYFGALIGTYPYKQLNIAETELFMSCGMEYPQMIFMDSGYLKKDAAARTLVHEIGHQWFYNIIGNNQIAEAWLDEGLLSFVQEGFFNDTEALDAEMRRAYDALAEFIEASGVDSSLRQSTAYYDSWNDYYEIQYVKGKLMFYALRRKMGAHKFDAFIKLYYSKYAYKTAAEANLRAAAEEAYGAPLDDFFEGWLADGLPPL
ncbi:MAG: M1 family metallopeptidase [Clostridiales bacterium]|jgi:hypothetical protein|nr:M1 family metallopeptidase [Clostridiales bacterium]